MNRLINQWNRAAEQVMNSRASVKLGIVDGYDPNTYSCTVRLLPDDGTTAKTGWLPVCSPWTGNGWGFYAPPTPGDVVDVHFCEADHNAAFVSQGIFHDSSRPLPCPSGELWIVHQSGAYVKLLASGEIHIGDAGAMKKLVTEAFETLFNGHTHQLAGVQAGSATLATLQPDQLISDIHMTSTLKAN